MNILAIDASANCCSVAFRNDNTIYQDQTFKQRAHAQLILPMVESVLSLGGAELDTLDAIAFGAGPGSFTGLRISLSFAQGLAFGLGIPLIPVSSLLAVACSIDTLTLDDNINGNVVVSLLDARMGELYWASHLALPGDTSTLVPPQLSTIESTNNTLLKLILDSSTPVHLVGPGAELLSEEVRTSAFLVDVNVESTAKQIVKLAVPLYLNGETTQPECAEPVYLRSSVSWKKRKRIRV